MEQLKKEIQDLKEQIARLQASNVLWGKKYVACGDSFTEGDFNHWVDENGLTKRESPVIYDEEWGMYKTYPWHIGKRNNMMIINEAKCGSILALDKRYVAGEAGITIESRNPFSLERYKQIPDDADYCTIWFGINDSAHTNLGTIDDTTNETFYGAWNVILEWMITNRPYMKIGIIVTDADAHSDWRKATRECACKWGIPYLDMMGDVRVPVIMGREPELGLCAKAEELRTKSFVVSDKNGHPNLKAHEYQSYIIENFLRSL